jgi:hypothetical protein
MATMLGVRVTGIDELPQASLTGNGLGEREEIPALSTSPDCE